MYPYVFLLFCLSSWCSKFLLISSVWRTFFSQFKGGSVSNKFFVFVFVRECFYFILDELLNQTQTSRLAVTGPLPSASRGFPWGTHCRSSWCSSGVFLGDVPGNFIFSFQEFLWCVSAWIWGVHPVWSLLSVLGCAKPPLGSGICWEDSQDSANSCAPGCDLL